MTDQLLSYLAGVLDAKGQIIRRSRARDSKLFVLRVVDSNPLLLEELANAFGGRVIEDTPATWNEKSTRLRYTWEMGNAIEAVRLVLPFLRVRSVEFEARLREIGA